MTSSETEEGPRRATRGQKVPRTVHIKEIFGKVGVGNSSFPGWHDRTTIRPFRLSPAATHGAFIHIVCHYKHLHKLSY